MRAARPESSSSLASTLRVKSRAPSSRFWWMRSTAFLKFSFMTRK
jgi:hypothetical protein